MGELLSRYNLLGRAKLLAMREVFLDMYHEKGYFH